MAVDLEQPDRPGGKDEGPGAHEPHGMHEETDVSVFSISKFGIGIGLSVVLTMMLMAWLLSTLTRVESEAGGRPSPIALTNPQKEPPEPRLQDRPLTDIQQVRADEAARITSYGWIDPDKNVVRIPVDRALELVAKEGLPARKGASE